MSIYQSFPDFIVVFTFVVLAPVILLFIDWRLALTTVTVFPAAIPFHYWYNKALTGGLTERSDILARVNSEIIEYVQGIEVLKAFKQTEKQFAKFDNTMHDFRKGSICLTLKAVVPSTISKTVLDLGLALILLFATIFLFNGTVSLTVFLIFLITRIFMVQITPNCNILK